MGREEGVRPEDENKFEREVVPAMTAMNETGSGHSKLKHLKSTLALCWSLKASVGDRVSQKRTVLSQLPLATILLASHLTLLTGASCRPMVVAVAAPWKAHMRTVLSAHPATAALPSPLKQEPSTGLLPSIATWDAHCAAAACPCFATCHTRRCPSQELPSSRFAVMLTPVIPSLKHPAAPAGPGTFASATTVGAAAAPPPNGDPNCVGCWPNAVGCAPKGLAG